MKNTLNKNLNQPADDKSQSNQSNQSNQPDPRALEMLINMASKKLGVPPAMLRAKIESGELVKAVQNNPDPKFDAVRAAMKDPAAAEKMAKDPSAAQMLKNISKGGFGRGR